MINIPVTHFELIETEISLESIAVLIAKVLTLEFFLTIRTINLLSVSEVTHSLPLLYTFFTVFLVSNQTIMN